MPAASRHSPACDRADLPPVAYENEPDAAKRPLPSGYRRRQPEKTALHAVVRDHLETLIEDAHDRHESGNGYPRFVENEFRSQPPVSG